MTANDIGVGERITEFLLKEHPSIVISRLYEDERTPIDVKVMCRKILAQKYYEEPDVRIIREYLNGELDK